MRCPTCAETVALAPAEGDEPRQTPPHFPFCSRRCKMIDLGHWFNEDFKVSRPVEQGDLPDGYGDEPSSSFDGS